MTLARRFRKSLIQMIPTHNKEPVYIGKDFDFIFSCLSRKKLSEIKRIIIKINMVSPHLKLSMTPSDLVEKLARYLINNGFYGEILIAEGSAGVTWDGFRAGGFVEIAKRYPNVELFDIHEDESIDIPILNKDFDEITVPVSKTLLTADFLISVCRAKTHDAVVVTLSIKNVAVGGIVGVYNRRIIHQLDMSRTPATNYKVINLNIAILGGILFPNFAIIDGRVGMEGNGPIFGFPKHWGWLFSSKNALNLDSLVATAMGFNPADIGYLYYLYKMGFGELLSVPSIGATLDDVKTSFKPHNWIEFQLKWRLPRDIEEYVIKKASQIVSKYSRIKR